MLKITDYDVIDQLRDAVESMSETQYARILKREFNAIVVAGGRVPSVLLHKTTTTML